MDYGAIIANWNGSGFIGRCLGSVLTAARQVPSLRILVVDDASSDDSPEIVARDFPNVELLRIPQNVGFGQAVNQSVAALNTPWIFLLNNDLALAPDFFSRLIAAKESLNDPSLFWIGAQTLEWGTSEPNHAGMLARWERGRIVQTPFECESLSPAHFIQAGACLLNRERFLALGGFCKIYHPGYWEDYDLSYQALRRGWNNYYEPRAKAHHWGKQSMRTLLGEYRLSLTIKRNHLLFNWINLSDPALLRQHLIGLPRLVARAPSENAPWHRALAAALRKLPEALHYRSARLKTTNRTDREILGIK